jgi:hypothetical protein
METKKEYEELKVVCINCRKRISEGKRWYHGDQDDLVCLDCAKDLQHLDTAYAGDYVSDMPTEINLNRMVLKTSIYLTDYDRAMQNTEMKSKDTSKHMDKTLCGFRERAEIQAQDNIPSNQDSMQINEDIGEN